jgi:hypothetical protein
MLNAINTLFFVPAKSPWPERLGQALSASSQEDVSDKVERHLDLLERRRAGQLDWRPALIEAGPNKQARAYSAMLKEEKLLPLYSYGPLTFTVDLFNPTNEGQDPAYDPDLEIIELMVHRDVINPWRTGHFPDGSKINHASIEDYRRLTTYGVALGDLATRWAEILDPLFAFSEGLQYHARWMDRVLSSTSVKNAVPPETKYWDYLWPLAYWSKDLLDEKLAERLKRLRLTEQQMQAIDSFERLGINPTWQELATGGLLVQYRFIFGSEGRGSRAKVETPLAQQAGLRTINLLYRT